MNNTLNATQLDPIQLDILGQIAELSGIPASGAYNIRVNGRSAGRASSPNITITPKPDGSGLDIQVKPGTKGETLYIPVVISETNRVELVYNDFFIGEGADITIVAGCGIHNGGDISSQHDGIHTFRLEKNARVLYQEKHYGAGDGLGERILNPVTNVSLAGGSYLEMDTVQIKGVDSTRRLTRGEVGSRATLVVREKLMTHGHQFAETNFEVNLDGEGSSANVISRSVARDTSTQVFLSKINGNNRCMGHSECDAIIMGSASVSAIPEISANHADASLIHEAAIGKIAGEQLVKLMTLGLSEEEAEAQIVNGFLK
jgi:Fe-S cluster assembly scaffold protein SufB